MTTHKRPRIYIAGPIVKGDLAHNIKQAEDAFYELMKAGLAPFCPHWSCYATGPKVMMLPVWSQREPLVFATAIRVHPDTKVEDWYETDLAWVEVADALLRLPGEGKGSDGEVARAQELGIPVFFAVADVVNWHASRVNI